ncbi:hypothetical protein [Vibrio harveyi]|uniref:hypothetical protein n=1 Tax=Vibrio harveyi TaxID=669 RepID=UPI00390C15D5
MRKPPKDLEIGTKKLTNNFGEIEIIEYSGHEKVRIRFTATGYEKEVKAEAIRDGGIRDPYHPTVCGVGYLGEGKYPTTSASRGTGHSNKCALLWRGMLGRCYSPKDSSYPAYGARGVRVCKEWHCYQTFAEWADNNGYFEGAQLDKDILGDGLLYSPETCKFVTQQENSEASFAKSYRFMKIETGEVIEVFNLRKFCRENQLDHGSMNRVRSGKRKTHKGWSLPEPE